MLKALAPSICRSHRETLYRLSYHTGATLSDSRIDIDGGIGTMFVFASKGRREMPDGDVYVDGAPSSCRAGQLRGPAHLHAAAGRGVHINAFNFPVWGMLEKLAPTLIAGVPAIVKPATATGYVAEAAWCASSWRAASCPRARCSSSRAAIGRSAGPAGPGRTWSASPARPRRR
jgi:oxepin-CoA hydrolase / 3-oxo-5,6-dehydrosuberyl-CoA semialdehyde dehydrogenase